MTNASKPTVVLVHVAFAHASGWSAVYGELTARGYPVYVLANPLPGRQMGGYLLGSRSGLQCETQLGCGPRVG
jgi:hypothetical protein